MMKCWHCGKELPEGVPFCDRCGAELQPPDPGRMYADSGPCGGPQWGGAVPPAPNTTLKTASLLFAALYLVVAGKAIIAWVGNLERLLVAVLTQYNIFTMAVAISVASLQLVLTVLVVAYLLMLAFRKTERNWDGLILRLTALFVVRLGVRVVVSIMVALILQRAQAPGMGDIVKSFAETVLFNLVTVVTLCGAGMYSGAKVPIFHGDLSTVADSVYAARVDLQNVLLEHYDRLRYLAAGSPQADERPQQGGSFELYRNAGRWHRIPYQQRYTGLGYYQAPHKAEGIRLEDCRSLLVLLLLSLVTFGIYGYYALYTWARDVNIACDGDHEHTGGLLGWLFCSILTLGFYPIYWGYNLAARLKRCGKRYGVEIRGGGNTVLVLLVLGLFTYGIGTFVAVYILLRNTNRICAAYNRAQGVEELACRPAEIA